MKRIRVLQTIAALVAMLLVLGLTYGLDRWYFNLQQSLSMLEIHIEKFYLLALAIKSLLALALVGLHWFVNVKAPPNRLISLTLFFFGGLLTFYPILQGVFRIRLLVNLIYQPLFPTKMLPFTCAFVMIIGAYGLLRKRVVA